MELFRVSDLVFGLSSGNITRGLSLQHEYRLRI